MPNKEIENQYNELRKKFKLPEFREIDFEMEISDFEETNFLLRAIIRRITERLDFYTTMVEEVIQPDASNLYAMHETRHFDDVEKKRMFDLYRKLMDFNRRSIENSLGHDEGSEAGLINDFFDEWKGIKKELLGFVKKMRDSWKTETDIKEDIGYLG
ncbi:hypothetical protein HYW20_05715 [Candidatus Woesearchaeota archaeon]|nr:hypothetical protein [Candidatus Woesearchaeota archaeon]